MDLSQRQSEIVDAARRAGRVDVDRLASHFGVTTQTIRRDLNELGVRGLLTRIHGGAVPATAVANVAYTERRAQAPDAKARIGARAAALIPGNCAVMLNIGTTTEQVARALYGVPGLVVISNNINVITILSGAPGKELILAGGEVRQADGAIVGEAAVTFIRQFRADVAVIGASALDEDGSVLDFDLREVSVARAILDSARKRVLVADQTKFDRSAPMRICDLSRIDVFVSDVTPPPAFRAACGRHGTEIVIADAEPEELRRHG